MRTEMTPGPAPPYHAALDSLSVTMATGQLLGLPVVILLVLSRRYTLVPRGTYATGTCNARSTTA